MKLEVGMYVRTKSGLIDKIIDTTTEYYELEGDECEKPYDIYKLTKYYYDDEFDEETKWFLARFFVKASHNIIDLIEVGDYVNGYKVADIDRGKYSVFIEEPKDYVWQCLWNNDIKSIVTKEQFEQMAYKVGE